MTPAASQRKPAAVSTKSSEQLRRVIEGRDEARRVNAAFQVAHGIEPTTRPDPLDVIQATARRQASRRRTWSL